MYFYFHSFVILIWSKLIFSQINLRLIAKVYLKSEINQQTLSISKFFTTFKSWYILHTLNQSKVRTNTESSQFDWNPKLISNILHSIQLKNKSPPGKHSVGSRNWFPACWSKCISVWYICYAGPIIYLWCICVAGVGEYISDPILIYLWCSDMIVICLWCWGEYISDQILIYLWCWNTIYVCDIFVLMGGIH